MNTYRPEHFEIRELVDIATYTTLGDRAWLVLDPRAVVTLDQLRDSLGPCTVNDWAKGPLGNGWQWCGFRPPGCTVGVPFSQHRFGRAFDCHFSDHTADQARMFIRANRNKFPFLTTLETDITWVHFDCRDHGGDDVQLIKP